MARYTDTLIAINDEDYKLARSKFNTDVRYVPGVGIDQEKFDITFTSKQRTALRSSLGLKKDDFAILYLAELSKRKNQLWLIASLAKLLKEHPRFHLLLAGQDSQKGKCQRLVKELGLQSNIHFLGYRNDVAQLLKASDLAVSSSLQEGLPVNVMEAMYSGLPLVVTPSRGVSDLVKDNINGFVLERRDSELFAQRIKDIADDHILRASFVLNNKRASRYYLLPDVLGEMEKIYFQKRTVLHLLYSTKFSGAENVASELIKGTEGVYNSYYCSPSGNIEAALKSRGIPHIVIKSLSYRELSRVVKQYKPVIIHAHDFRASILASFFAHKSYIISHIHQRPSWLNGTNINFYLYKLRAHAFASIFVVSSAIKDTKLFQTLPTNKVIVKPNRINKNVILEKASATTGPVYDLGFCGRLEAVKRPLDFIRIVAEIQSTNKNVKAIMIGNGSLYGQCLDLIKQLGLEKNITLVGFQANPYKYIKGCRFLVITSEAEGFGLTAVEAILLGTLVISYDIPSIREIVSPHVSTLGQTPRELVDIYNKYSQNDQLYDDQVSATLETIGSYTNTAGQNIDVDYYSRILEGNKHE